VEEFGVLEALKQQSQREPIGSSALERPILEEALDREILEHTLEARKTLEQGPLDQTETLEQKMLEELEAPTKEQLHKLKEVLGLGKGSLHYKKGGHGIYQVTYCKTTKKYLWTRIGSWPELKAKQTE